MMLPALAAGIALAAIGVVHPDPHDAALADLIQLTLILTLFADGLIVERELLRLHWRPVTRAIVLAMPITMGLLALGARALFPGLDWLECLLLAAILMPTDPVVTSGIVKSTRVPRETRHVLNLESGLNDGLAVPFVVLFLVLAEPMGQGTLAFGFGDVVSDCSLVVAFVGGVVVGVLVPRIPPGLVALFTRFSGVFQLAIFFVFGALAVTTGYGGAIWRLGLFIAFALVIARPLAIAVSFLGDQLPRAQTAFIAWFGPKGAASMLFAVLVLQSTVPAREAIFDIAAFTILASIVAHGLSDRPGARWLERRLAET